MCLINGGQIKRLNEEKLIFTLIVCFSSFMLSEHKIETNERENQSYDSIKIYDFIFIYSSNKQPNKRKKYNI